MNLSALRELADRWQEEAERYEADGVSGHAALLRRVADELETWWRERELEELTLEQASELGGYSYSALEKGVRTGTIPNAGESGRPRIRRRDVPRKPGRNREPGEPDLAAIARG